MDTSAKKHPHSCAKGSAHVRIKALASYLHRLHPAQTAYEVSARTGISPRTVERWLELGACPSLPHFMALVRAYGPDLLAATLPDQPDWLLVARKAETRARLNAERARIDEELARL